MVTLKTTDGAKITVETGPDSLGRIEIEPFETDIAGGLASMVESTVLWPGAETDYLILQFLAEHSKVFRDKVAIGKQLDEVDRGQTSLPLETVSGGVK